jgi:uncharacterized protein YcbK (DUF882 family)
VLGVSCVEQNQVTDVGHRFPLTKKFAKALASMAIVGTLALGAWSFVDATPTVAGGETRTISLYHIHTKESLSVTYMKDGRYIPSAMTKINYFLRDWRRNEPTTIDPRTIDLVWELHADLGSRKPINIVSGYRSARTNAFLKKIGRKVANKSQHIRGKAIDFFFPDVPTTRIRNSALVRRVGGVGYYSSAGGPTGFLHVDSGNVRHWGPGMGGSQMAGLLREGKKYVGKRLTGKQPMATTSVEVASEDDDNEKSGGLWGLVTGKKGKKTAPDQTAPLDAYNGGQLAQWSEDAAAVGADTISSAAPLDEAIVDQPVIGEKQRKNLVDPDTDGLASMAQTAAVESLADGSADEEGTASSKALAASSIVKPRLKPRTVLQLALHDAEGVTIQPANAPPESQQYLRKKPSPVASQELADLSADAANEEDDSIDVVSNVETKTSFNPELRDQTQQDGASIQPSIASLGGASDSWWNSLFASAKQVQANDEVAAKVDANLEEIMPRAAILGEDGAGIVGFKAPTAATGKSDMLSVNREGKGNLPPLDMRMTQATTPDPSLSTSE